MIDAIAARSTTTRGESAVKKPAFGPDTEPFWPK